MGQAMKDQWTRQDLMEVAKSQKHIIWMILISFGAMFIPFATIVTGIIQIYFIYKLATALRSSSAWVYILLVFIPLVGVIALLVINDKATKKLRENGIKVGLMGARMADFDKEDRTNENILDHQPNVPLRFKSREEYEAWKNEKLKSV